MNYSINLRIHNRLKKRWEWLRVAYEDWCVNILPLCCKMHSYIWLKKVLPYVTKEAVRTCINCKRAEKIDDNFIKCDGLIHVSMAQEMADGCLQYLPKE